MEQIYYDIVYCVGFVLSLALYFVANHSGSVRGKLFYGNNYLPLHRNVCLSILWPLVLLLGLLATLANWYERK